jgi:hypothetical protein
MTLTTLDRVRLEIGDLDASAPLFTDDEINAYLDDYQDNILATAAALCDALATRYAVKADTTIGSLSFKWSNVSDAFAKRAQALRLRAGTTAPFAGGTSQADKDARAADPDRVQLRAGRGQFDHPSTADPGAFPTDGLS